MGSTASGSGAEPPCEGQHSATPAEPATQWLGRLRPPKKPGPSRTELVQNITAHQRAVWRSGRRVLVEEYLRQHPELQNSAAALTLIQQEYQLRTEAGEAPSLEEYRQRFPQFAGRLDERLLVPAEAPTVSHGTDGGASESDSFLLLHSLPVVPGHELLSALGRGGMGIVFKARQVALNRIVALKMIWGSGAVRPEARTRFRREAEAVALLDHPNIVPIYEVGDSDGHPYFSMKLIEGGNLGQRIELHRRQPRQGAQVVARVARAVHHAHQRGILHRDLKPGNILLDSQGEPHVTDFGLARRVEGEETLTQTGAIVGTPAYMAPEQARSEKALSVATDVWGLGAILYELLTGDPPFQGETSLDTIMQVLEKEPRPPRGLDPTIDPDLETICLKCLQKEPHRRYASAEALAEDLERWLRGEPIEARPAGRIERLWRWARRRPAVAALAALVLLSLLGGASGITAAWLHALAGWKQARQLGERAQQEHARAEQGREEAEANLYFSRVTQADLQRRLNKPEEAEQLLQLCVPQETAVDRRGWEWHYLKGLLHADLLTIAGAHQDMIADVAFSPDGRHLASAGGSPFPPYLPDYVRIWEVWGAQSGVCLKQFPQPHRTEHVVYGANGRQLVWAGMDGTIQAADLQTGQVVLRRHLPPDCHDAFFSADGRYYATGDSHGRVRVWDLDREQECFTAKLSRGNAVSACFSPDDRRLLVSAPDGLQLWQMQPRQQLWAIPREGSRRSALAFSPDGRFVALGTHGGMTRILDAATGRLVSILAGHAGEVLAVAFSPDGKHLATGGSDTTIRLWDWQSTAEIMLFRGQRGRACCLSFHPSGRYLASGGEQSPYVKVWDLTRPQEYLAISPHGPAQERVEAIGFSHEGTVLHVVRISGILQGRQTTTGLGLGKKTVDLPQKPITATARTVFTADGRQLATVSKADLRVVKIVDVASGKVLHRLEHPCKVLQLAFSADGRRLVASLEQATPPQRAQVVWDVQSGHQLARIPCEPSLPELVHGALAVAPHGEWLVHDEYVRDPAAAATAGLHTRILVRDAVTGEVRHTLELRGQSFRPAGIPVIVDKLACSADGRYLAVGCDDDGVLIYDLPAGGWLRPLPLNGSASDACFDLAFNADGRRLAAVTREQVFLWDVASGQMVLGLRGAPPRPSDNSFNPRIIWSPDGRFLAASNWDNSVSIWDTAERQSPQAKQALQQAAKLRANYP